MLILCSKPSAKFCILCPTLEIATALISCPKIMKPRSKWPWLSYQTTAKRIVSIRVTGRNFLPIKYRPIQIQILQNPVLYIQLQKFTQGSLLILKLRNLRRNDRNWVSFPYQQAESKSELQRKRNRLLTGALSKHDFSEIPGLNTSLQKFAQNSFLHENSRGWYQNHRNFVI